MGASKEWEAPRATAGNFNHHSQGQPSGTPKVQGTELREPNECWNRGGRAALGAAIAKHWALDHGQGAERHAHALFLPLF